MARVAGSASARIVAARSWIETPVVQSWASAGGAITAARLVMEKKEDKAFALVRPPGHHAMRVTHGNRIEITGSLICPI